MKNSNSKTWSVLKRMLKYLRPHYLWITVAVLFSLAAALIKLVISVSIKGLADSAINHDMNMLKNYIVLGFMALAADVPSNILRTYGAGRFAEYSLYDIRKKTAEHISNLAIPYLENHPSGDMITRLTSDVNLLQGFLQNTLKELIFQPMQFMAAFVFLFVINWKLALFSLTVIPILIAISVKISKPMEKHTKAQQEAQSLVNSVAQDSISGLIVTKSFGLEDIMKDKFEKSVGLSVSKGLKVSLFQALLEPAGLLMQMLPFMLTFVFGGYLVIKKEMTFGSLLSFINLMNYVANPVQRIPELIGTLRSTAAAVERVFEIWDEPGERKDGEEFERDKAKPAIEFNDVCFAYDKDNALFENLSFKVMEGETVALVGPSGCGKSTILKLITGFYEPSSGSISIYGRNLDCWSLDSVRKLFSMVTQDTYLFPQSIYANIEYGREGISKEEVIEASKAADIHDFILSLPEGYGTAAGERGVKLSGGQRQRIAIARAILKDAPILLLDEATSALDAESEHEVQCAIERLMQGRTALVVAHRLSTIKNADRILVIDNGIIVESGSHEELIRRGRLYKQLYYKQFGQEDGSNMKFAVAGR